MPDQDYMVELLDELTPGVQEAVELMFEELYLTITLEEVERFIAVGGLVDAVQRTLDLLFGGLSEAYLDAYERSGKSAAAYIAAVTGTPFVFDRLNDRGARAIRNAMAGLAAVLSNAQARALNQAYSDAFSLGLSEAAQAAYVREAIGLNEFGAQLLGKYRQTLRLSALDDDGPTPQAIERMSRMYALGLRKKRYVSVAEAETLSALNLATFEAFKQGEEAGAVWEKTWITQGDSRVRDSHQSLNGLTVEMDEVFHGFNGDLLFPGDPAAPAIERVRCRCHLRYQLKG